MTKGAKITEITGIFSAKGGVGKTTIAINLGLALQQLGSKVLLMDDGSNSIGIELLLGMEHFLKFQPLSRKRIKRDFVEENIIVHSSGLKVIPSFLSPTILKLKNSATKKLLKGLDVSMVFIDFSPGLHERTRKVLRVCDSVILVTTPDLLSVTEAVRAKQFAERNGKEVKGVILNRYGSSRYDLTQKEVELGFNLPVIGIVAEDDEVKRSFFRREPLITLNPFAKASIGFKRIASRMFGKEYNPGKLVWLKRFKHRMMR